jgi:hypothetical protein
MSALGFDENIKNEIIVLSHLQSLSNGIGYFDYFGSLKKLKKESLRKYIKIDSKKVEELINKFITDKLKVYFTFEKNEEYNFYTNKLLIDKTKIYQIDGEHLKIYDNKYIHKLYNIKLDCSKEESSKIDIKGPKIDIPNFGQNIKGPKLPGLDIRNPAILDADKNSPKIDIPNFDQNIKGPKLDTHDPVILNADKKGPKIGLTNLDINIKSPKIGARIEMNPPKIGSLNPSVDNVDKKGTKIETKPKIGRFKLEMDEIFNKILHRPKICTDEYLYGTDMNAPKIGDFFDIRPLELLSLIELENNDLIILCKANRKYNILIYRLENKEYFLFDKIKYQNYISIQKLMKNRFLVYDDGYAIYSLNKNKGYSLISKENYPKSMNGNPEIYEINQNKYIICSKGIYNTHHHINIFEKYNIKYEYTEIRVPSIGNDESLIGKEDVFKIRKKKDITIFEIFFCNELMLRCITEGSNSYYYDHISFKEKYSIIKYGNNIIVLDLLKSKILKRYTILFYNDDDKLIIDNFEIKKWNNINDNEFILILGGNITLFKLNDKNSEINLEILAYSYFPNLIGQYLKKIDENNRFCGIQYKNHLQYTVYFY